MDVSREEELFTAYANGRMQPEEQTELKALLGDDGQARQRFGEFLEETAVFIQVGTELSTPASDCDLPVLPAPSLASRPIIWIAPILAAAAAAILAFAILRQAPVDDVETATIPPEKPEQAQPLTSTARVTSVVAARFDGSMDAWLDGDDQYPTAGSWLTTNKTLNLAAGVISLTLESGVAVTLEGPASFHIESADRLHLEHGRVYAEVPPGLAGFVVSSPAGTVVDLGTRFGYEVRRDGTASLHVFEGIVEYWPPDSNSAMLERLRAGEAIAIDAKGQTSPENYASERFIRVPDQRRQSRFVKWSCDSDDTGYLYGFGQPVDLIPSGTPPTPVDGKYDGAIRFGAETAPLTADWRAITGSNARTIACWVRVPPAANGESAAIALASWGKPKQDKAWQLTWNLDPERGTVGALASSTGDSRVTTSTDLRDGTWHHVTAVVIGSSSSNLATHVRHYVDGELESVSYADNHPIQTASGPMMVGQRNVAVGTTPASVEIDELIILDDALSGVEVRELMREGPPPNANQ